MNIPVHFLTPPRTHSPLAFWFWNGELKADLLRWQMDEMVDKGVYGGFMHSRGYLRTPYLEQPWWDAVDACLDQAKKNGFFPWLYDEYAWPSGTAGSTFEYSYQKPSRVLAEGEANMAKGLAVRMVDEEGNAVMDTGGDGLLIARYALTGTGDELRASRLSDGMSVPAGSRLLEFRRQVYPTYVDYMNPSTIRSFIKYTHEEYKKRYGKDFGTLSPGVCFDEIYMTGSPFPWTDRLPEEFSRRTGRDLLEVLPFLVEEGGSSGRQARSEFFEVSAQLYEEAFFVQISQWCEENNLALTGHTEEHLAGHPTRQGNFFDTVRNLQIPGADNHDYRYRFPRKITYVEPKYAVSVARAYSRERAMSEAMGGAGWGCSLQQFKRGINTMGAMGISMFTLHGFYYECDHQGSQADWPTSFFYQNPYWRHFKKFADYISRICFINSAGRAVVEVGLLYPIEDMQTKTVAGRPSQAGIALNHTYHRVLTTLLEHQIDADLIDRRSILKATVSDGFLCIGQQQFKLLILPGPMDPDPVLEQQLDRFVQGGGHVLRCGCENDGSIMEPERLLAAVNALLPTDIQVVEGSRFDLYTNHRVIEGKDWYFVSNSSPRPRVLSLRLRTPYLGGMEKYSPETGTAVYIPAEAAGNGTEVRLELAPDEACYLVPCSPTAAPVLFNDAEELAVAGRWDFLPLDATNIETPMTATKTTLDIPLAVINSNLHHEPAKIRIRNTAWEEGHCGRHLSLWSARWISRRPSWHCSAFEADMFFRRTIELSSRPMAAGLCIAAVNSFTLWVNGNRVKKAESLTKPVEIDVTDYLVAGQNLIAVHVHNATPLPDANLNAMEDLPPDRIISLLLQGKMTFEGVETTFLCTDEDWIVSNREEEGWNLPGGNREEKAVRIDASACSSFGAGAPDGTWVYAWERGAPPLLPWGDLPLFGETVSYPVTLRYGITLPAGTSSISCPDVAGDCEFRLDGMPVVWKEETLRVHPQPFPRLLDIAVKARGPEDGLRKPVTVNLESFPTSLGDWRLHGLDWFSGHCLYQNRFHLNKREGRYILDLGQVCFCAEIWINGRKADVRVWEPFQADITDFLADGWNNIAVVTANSAAVERRHMLVDEGQALGWARYWNVDNIEREGENLVSGLLGPVRIFRRIPEKVELK